jgi:RNA polymerase sigma-70 factor (ECF subfamily)
MRWPTEARSQVTRDARAFRRIYDEHAPPVYRFLRDLLRDAAAAEEATQETFVRAHAGWERLERDDRVLAWLFGIARNVAYEAMRARKRVIPMQESDLPEPENVPAPPDPESLLMGREADALLGEALALLSEERRAALLMAIDHGLPYGEIAEVMGWSLAKVKVEIHRARLVLRAHVAKVQKRSNEGEHVV